MWVLWPRCLETNRLPHTSHDFIDLMDHIGPITIQTLHNVVGQLRRGPPAFRSSLHSFKYQFITLIYSYVVWRCIHRSLTNSSLTRENSRFRWKLNVFWNSWTFFLLVKGVRFVRRTAWCHVRLCVRTKHLQFQNSLDTIKLKIMKFN